MSSDSMQRVRFLAWGGAFMALLSLLALHSVLFQFVFLGLGAMMFILAAQRIVKAEAFTAFVAKKAVLVISWVAAASFFLRFAILLLTSQPAQYGDYVVGEPNPLVQGVAANTSIFYIASLVLLFGSVLVMLAVLHLPKHDRAAS